MNVKMHRDAETGEYYLVNEDTGQEIGRGTLAEMQGQQGQLAAGAESEAGAGIPVATEATRTLPLEFVPRLKRWQEQTGFSITETEAAMARAYEYLGVTFEEALNVYYKWREGWQGVPGPFAEELRQWHEASQATGELEGEIERIRTRGGLEPAIRGLNLPPEVMQLPLIQAIMAATDDPRVQLSMIVGAMVEGGGLEGPWGRGDAGAAAGPYQIHGLPPEQAEDAARAVQFMMNEHVGGQATYPVAVAAIPDEMWQTDPIGVALLATANAERVGGWHEGLTVEEAVNIYGGRERVQAKFSEAGAVAPSSVAGGGLPTGYPQAPAATGVARALRPEEYDAWVRLNAATGITQDAFTEATDKGMDPAVYWADIQRGAAVEDVRPLVGDAWSEQEITDAVGLGLTEADIRTALAAGQKPMQWWQAQMNEAEARIKGMGATWEDVEAMLAYEIPALEFQEMKAVEMTPPQWAVARQRMTPDQIFAAKNLGYDPSTMSPEQRAIFDLKTDLNVATMRVYESLPETIKPELTAGVLANIRDTYTVAQSQARAQGRYVAPDDYLRSEYPGFFGGGTVGQLRSDAQRLFQERPAAFTGMSASDLRSRAGLVVAQRMGTGQLSLGGGEGGYRGKGFTTIEGVGTFPDQIANEILRGKAMTPYGEMQYQRALAQGILQKQYVPGPAEAQARYAQTRSAVGVRYPALLATLQEEEETEEEKKRKRLLAGLTPAGGTTPMAAARTSALGKV